MSAETVTKNNTKNQEHSAEYTDQEIKNKLAHMAMDSIDGFTLFESERRAFDDERIEMKTQLVGKDKAIDAIFDQLTLFEMRPESDQRPAATFAFVGPDGVGKKKTADVLGQVIGDGSGDNVIVVDCYDYLDSERISHLVSSIAQFVVENDEETTPGLPSNVVVFENPEYATAELQYWMMQILDGIILPYNLVDTETGDGEKGLVEWQNSIIVFSFNTEDSKLGFQPNTETEGPIVAQSEWNNSRSTEQFKRILPEFHKRINKEISFRELNKSEYSELFDLYIEERNDEYIQRYGIYVSIDDEARNYLIDKISKIRPRSGALKEIYTEGIQRRLSVAILNGEIEAGTEVRVFEQDGQLVFGSRPDETLLFYEDDEDGFPINVIPGEE